MAIEPEVRSSTSSAPLATLTSIVPFLTKAVFDEAVRYSKTRVQFGQRIGDFQLIQLKLAKMEELRGVRFDLDQLHAEILEVWRARY